MRYIIFLFSLLICTTLSGQIDLLKQSRNKAHTFIKKNNKLTESEIAEGLTEVLIQGANKAVRLASENGGFTTNNLIRIPFPEDAEKMKDVLIKYGMSNQVSIFENKMNLAAEKASKKALDIFLHVIQMLTIDDAVNILKGEDNAATNFLKTETSEKLYVQFKPIITNVIAEIQVTKYWNSLAKKYNKLPLTKPVNTDLEDYITNKAIQGIFVLIALEEKNIRTNTHARHSTLIKKIFQ